MFKFTNNYLFVALTEYIILSTVYWLFFSFDLFTTVTYLLCSVCYFTAYILWNNEILLKNKKFLITDSEHFFMTGIVCLLFIFILNSFCDKNLYTMIPVYSVFLAMFILYYVYRIKKQKSFLKTNFQNSPALKFLIIMNFVFLIFDFFVNKYNALQIQLMLYIPVLFGIYTFIIFIYKKEISFKSFVSLAFLVNIYIISTVILVLNFIGNNFFTFTLIIHFILFCSIANFFLINSKNNIDEENFGKYNLVGLFFPNVILCFIVLNDVACLNAPNILANYTLLVSALLITYLSRCIYKILAKM